MRKIGLIAIIFTLYISGCAGGVIDGAHRHAKADDSISKTMLDSIGEDYWYSGKGMYSDEWVRYGYVIRKNDPSVVETFASAVSNVEITGDENIIFSVVEESSNGYYDELFVLSNYDCYDGTVGETLDFFGYLKIRHDVYAMDVWYSPETYTSFENIRYLEIPDALQKKAEEEGIDWYEVWPDLETVEVIETGFLRGE